MFSGHKVVCNCHFSFTIFFMATPFRHWRLTKFRISSGPWLVSEALGRCREAKQLSRAQLCLNWYFSIIRIFLKIRAGHLQQLSRQFEHVLRPKTVSCCLVAKYIFATFRYFEWNRSPNTLWRCRCQEAKNLSHVKLCLRYNYKNSSRS